MAAMTLPAFLSSEQDDGFRGLAKQLSNPVNRALAMYQIELLVEKNLVEVRTNHLGSNKFFFSTDLGAITPHHAGLTHAYYLPRTGRITAERHQIRRRELQLKFPWLQCMTTFGGIQGYGKQARKTQRRNGRSPPALKLRHMNQYPLELITIQETTHGVLKEHAHRWAPQIFRGTQQVPENCGNLGNVADAQTVELAASGTTGYALSQTTLETMADPSDISITGEPIQAVPEQTEADMEAPDAVVNGSPIHMFFRLLLWFFGIAPRTEQEESLQADNEEMVESVVGNDDQNEDIQSDDTQSDGWASRSGGWEDIEAVEPLAPVARSNQFPPCARPVSPQLIEELNRFNPTRSTSTQSRRSTESRRSNGGFGRRGFRTPRSPVNRRQPQSTRRSESRQSTVSPSPFGGPGFGSPAAPTNVQQQPTSSRSRQRSPSPQTSRGGFGNRRAYPEHSITLNDPTISLMADNQLRISGPTSEVRRFLVRMNQLCQIYAQQNNQ